ncbi:hypothetical protein [cf. Phormidesmis sp. LEGE 11477]|uniref:hypothetical protein n=1 Tax=cf. Phormidesmis sp. LEGE 11477 TaxID=1828680 RepID=UPI00188147E8|nr:hypothetical protein [cf. Phormidesmis sp. LEGE 11477]MBE9062524.1 hypothetical protein [cf. Phormidesmis sp. LEGE 11477]
MRVSQSVIASLGPIKQQLTCRFREANAYLSNYTRSSGPPDTVRVVIFAQGRTGSTFLESLLCSSGYFRQNGELLSTRYGEVKFPISFISGLSKRTQGNFIFHVKLPHLTKDRANPVDPNSFLQTLYADGWKIIYLRRENKVKHALSNIVAKHRGNYHKLDTAVEDFKILFKCEQLTKRVNRRTAYEEQEKEALVNVEFHEVIYEKDLESTQSHQQTADRIFEYLSLPPKAVTTQYKKVNSRPLEELMSNYDEFVDCLHQHGLQTFL